MSDIEALGEEWAAKADRGHAADADARFWARGAPRPMSVEDWASLVRTARERDEAWQRLRDAVEADEERKRIRAEAER